MQFGQAKSKKKNAVLFIYFLCIFSLCEIGMGFQLATLLICLTQAIEQQQTGCLQNTIEKLRKKKPNISKWFLDGFYFLHLFLSDLPSECYFTNTHFMAAEIKQFDEILPRALIPFQYKVILHFAGKHRE